VVFVAVYCWTQKVVGGPWCNAKKKLILVGSIRSPFQRRHIDVDKSPWLDNLQIRERK
jgi:hypothetical protein